MPKSHRPYSPEFRQRIVELVRKGRTSEELARQFEPSAQAIRNWVKQAALDAGKRTDGLTTDEREELRRLRCRFFRIIPPGVFRNIPPPRWSRVVFLRLRHQREQVISGVTSEVVV